MKAEKLCPWAKPVPILCDSAKVFRHCYQCSVYREFAKRQNAEKRQELAQRRELERQLLLWDRHVYPQTPHYHAADWYRRILLLKIKALERYGIPADIEHQMFYATGGPGCRKDRPVGEIDGYLVCNRQEVTFLRSDFYGIPNDWGIRLYRESTGIDLHTYLRSQ